MSDEFVPFADIITLAAALQRAIRDRTHEMDRIEAAALARSALGLGRIDTIEQFTAARAAMVPVYIASPTHGRVLVPCANTLLVRPALIVANGRNHNSVSPDKLELLRQSILDNGFCFPIVAIWDDETGRFIIIDGPDWLDFDYVPVAVLSHNMSKWLAAPRA